MDCKLFGTAFMVLALLCRSGWAADDSSSCIPALTPCASFLNTSGTPDKSCCTGLIGVIDKDPQCLCGLLKSDTVKQLGINMTKAMELPARCGKNVTADQCKTSSSSSAPPTATPKAGSSSNSSSSGSTGTKGDSNLASTGAGFSIMSLTAWIIVGVFSHLLVGEIFDECADGMKPSLVA